MREHGGDKMRNSHCTWKMDLGPTLWLPYPMDALPYIYPTSYWYTTQLSYGYLVGTL